jgi:hypothetical protein
MSNKIKKLSTAEKLTDLSAKLGIIIMSAATTLGMVELPSHIKAPVLVSTSKPAFAYNSNESNGSNPMSRERDDITAHYISYNESQRTPSRSGRR